MHDSLIIREPREALEKKAAEILAKAIRQSISKKNQAVLAVPGGRSVGAVMKRLETELIDWSRVHVFMVDERLVATGHPESNFELAKSCLAPFVPELNLHPFPLSLADHEAACDAYSSELTSYGGRFDAVLLSAGEDGHIASLFPFHQTIQSDAPMFLTTNSAPKPPPGRMSASRRLIGSSRLGIVLFFGEGKKDALNLFLDESISMVQCPAKIIDRLPVAYVLTDLYRKTP
jgi:6-phosphogluconolactonase